MPKRDRVFRDLIDKVVKETGLKIGDVESAVEFYFKTTATLIQWDNPVTIHFNYIGDLQFNHPQYKKYLERKNGSSTTEI